MIEMHLSLYDNLISTTFSKVPSLVNLQTELGPHDSLLKAVTFSPDGLHLASATVSGLLTIWDTTRWCKLHSLVGHTSTIRDLKYSPDGCHLASVAVEMCLKVWNAKAGYKLETAWYGPTNKLAFVKDNVIMLGEATGNKRRITFV